MKISLNWCPLCEKNRLVRLEPTIWSCDRCNVLFELTNFFYGREDESNNNNMVLRYQFTIVDRGEGKDDDSEYDGRTPL